MCSNGISFISTCGLESCPVTGHQWKESFSIFFCPLPGQVSVHIDLKSSSSLSLSSYRRCSSPLTPSWPFAALFPETPYFSCTGESNERHSTPKLPSLVLSWKEGSPSFDLLVLLNAAQGTVVLHCYKTPLLAHVHLGVHQVLLWKAVLQMVGFHPCTARGWSSSGAALPNSPCWISGGSC